MQASGGLAQVNRSLKAAGAATPSLRYRDHLDAFKIKLVEQIAALDAHLPAGGGDLPHLHHHSAGSISARIIRRTC
jgi:hypothetical protein